MRFKIIACEVLFRELSLCAAQSEHIVDLVFLTKGLHDNPGQMTEVLQEEIDATDPAQDCAVVLGYALCSRGTVGLRARDLPLIVPRAHDCITFFLGSREAYNRHFASTPGTYYFTAGWIERGGARMEREPHQGQGMGKSLQEYLEKYGEDNGRFLWEFENQWQKSYTTAAYIQMPLSDRPEVRAQAEQVARDYNWQVAELTGSDRLFRAMCAGEWPEADFASVPPGYQTAQASDDSVIKVVPAP